MCLVKLFNKYYQQISNALLPGYKKSVGKLYLKEIKTNLEEINNSDCQAAIDRSNYLMENFRERYGLTFKPLVFPEDAIKQKIQTAIEPKWSGWKTILAALDRPKFYKSVENNFIRFYEGIVNATEIMARDLKICAEIQTAYNNAFNLGKYREKFVENLRYLSNKIAPVFSDYYASIEELRNRTERYSEQTIEEINLLKEKLSSQVEELIEQEKSFQSAYQQFFLEYRLLITQQIDPIVDKLTTFNLGAKQKRSEFIDRLISLENQHPEELEQYRSELDEYFEALLVELQQMRSVEQSDRQARQYIQDLANVSTFQFFEDVAEEAQEIAFRSIGDCIRQASTLLLMLEQIESYKKTYENRIHQILEAEKSYLNLREEAINSMKIDIKFSLELLNLTPEKIDNLFVSESSYRVFPGELNNYDLDAAKASLERLATDGMLLTIGEIGNVKPEPIEVEKEFSLELFSEELERKIQEQNHANLVGFVPILVDESERLDVPAFLFFCRDLEKGRPELTGLLEIVQQGQLIYIRKTTNICPLKSPVLNDMLEIYKATFRSKSKLIKEIVADEFLANKLKLDFQGAIAKPMTQAKLKIKKAYLEELKEYALSLVSKNNLEKNVFFLTVDRLVIQSLDAILGFEQGEQEKFW